MHLTWTLWLHLIGAALLVGGGIMFGAVVMPTLRLLPEAQRASYLAKIARRYANLAWLAIVLLLVTGLSQLALNGYPIAAIIRPNLIPGPFGQTFGYKMLVFWVLVLVMVAEEIAAPLLRQREQSAESTPADFKPGELARARRTNRLVNASFGGVILLLALAVLWFGVQLGRFGH